MFATLIEKLVRHEDLTMEEATAAMREVTRPGTAPSMPTLAEALDVFGTTAGAESR